MLITGVTFCHGRNICSHVHMEVTDYIFFSVQTAVEKVRYEMKKIGLGSRLPAL